MSESTELAASATGAADPQSAAAVAFKARLEADPAFRQMQATVAAFATTVRATLAQSSAISAKATRDVEAVSEAFRSWDAARVVALEDRLSIISDEGLRQAAIDASESERAAEVRRLLLAARAADLVASRAQMAVLLAAEGVWVAAEVRWVLSGDDGPSVDREVGRLINRGVHVEAIEPGRKYRLNGPRDLCDGLVTPEDKREGAKYVIDYEVPPADRIDMGTRAAPGLQYRRQLFIHGGGDVLSFVARAIDRGLIVAPVGNLRFSVTGRTAALMAWAATVVHCKPLEEVLPLYGLTPQMVAEEDGTPVAGPLSVAVVSMPEPGPLSVNVVSLPTRETTTQVVRDQAGEIREVRHTETTR